jgi:hypothetical protein
MNGCAKNILMKVCPPMPSGGLSAEIQKTYSTSCGILEYQRGVGRKPYRQTHGGSSAKIRALDGIIQNLQSGHCVIWPSEGRVFAENPTRCLGNGAQKLQTGKAAQHQSDRKFTEPKNGRHLSNTSFAETHTPASGVEMGTTEATCSIPITLSLGRQTRPCGLTLPI